MPQTITDNGELTSLSSVINKDTLWSKMKIYIICAMVFIISLTLVVIVILVLVIFILISVKKINLYKTN
jgi:hypothetical protein